MNFYIKTIFHIAYTIIGAEYMLKSNNYSF